MKLPRPAPRYDMQDQAEMRIAIERADDLAHKRNRDVEIGAARLILTAPNGTRYVVSVSNAGAIQATVI
jgi:hypothetical protein